MRDLTLGNRAAELTQRVKSGATWRSMKIIALPVPTLATNDVPCSTMYRSAIETTSSTRQAVVTRPRTSLIYENLMGSYDEAVRAKNAAENVTMVLYLNDASENGKAYVSSISWYPPAYKTLCVTGSFGKARSTTLPTNTAFS